ncbi:MAG TPA: BON domain-containing protein [Ramlibacter sp.]|nr:BON domain-containing protein [Ramlibacter sp.]
MKAFHQKGLMVASSLAMLLALGACDRGENRTVGQSVDSAGQKTSRAANRAKEETQDAAARASAMAKNAGDSTKAMGSSAADKVDDAMITTKVKAGLAADKDLSAIKIEVDTKDGVVTLTGPAPSASARDHATELAKNVKGVTSVNNNLTVKAG